LVIVTNWGHPMQVFANGCGRLGATCRPLWRSARKVTGVTVRGRRIYAAETFPVKNGELGGIAMYRTDCHPVHGVCQPVWFDTVGPINTRRSRPNPTQFGAPTLFTTPVVTGGVVYTSGAADLALTHPGEIFSPLYAFPARCPSTACAALWRTAGRFGAAPPLVRWGVAYLPSASGLYAYPAACRTDGEICRPLWHGGTNIDRNPSNYMDRPVVRGGEVLVTTEGDVGGGDAVPPSLYAFPVGCRSDGGACGPDWWSMIDKRERWTSRPLASAGRVIVSSVRYGLVEYPLHCGTGGLNCRRRTYLGHGHSIYGGRLMSPVLYGDQVVTSVRNEEFHRGDGLATFSVACAKRRCSPTSTWSPGSHIGPGWASTRDAFFTSWSGRVLALTRPGGGSGKQTVFWRWAVPGEKSASDITAGAHSLFVIAGPHLYAVSYPVPKRR